MTVQWQVSGQELGFSEAVMGLRKYPEHHRRKSCRKLATSNPNVDFTWPLRFSARMSAFRLSATRGHGRHGGAERAFMSQHTQVGTS